MIAVRVTGPMKVGVVGAPATSRGGARRARPTISRATAASNTGGRTTALSSSGRSSGTAIRGGCGGWPGDGQYPYLAIRAAVDGLGIAYTIEALAEPFLRSGQLVRVLEDWSPSFEGFFLYYPGHRQVPAALRAFIDMIRTARNSAPTRSSLQNPFTED